MSCESTAPVSRSRACRPQPCIFPFQLLLTNRQGDPPCHSSIHLRSSFRAPTSLSASVRSMSTSRLPAPRLSGRRRPRCLARTTFRSAFCCGTPGGASPTSARCAGPSIIPRTGPTGVPSPGTVRVATDPAHLEMPGRPRTSATRQRARWCRPPTESCSMFWKMPST